MALRIGAYMYYRIPTTDFLGDEEDRKVLVSLLNMAVARHANRSGLVSDSTKNGRFFFPPADGGENVIRWKAFKRTAPRTVAKPCAKDEHILFWRHQGAYLSMLYRTT
jgi:hypothetical protein